MLDGERRVGSRPAPSTTDDVGLVEDQPGPRVGVVVVDRHVGRAHREDAEHGDVQLDGPGRDPHPYPVTAAHTLAGQPVGDAVDGDREVAVGERRVAVVDSRRVRVRRHGGGQHVDQRPGGRRRRATG